MDSSGTVGTEASSQGVPDQSRQQLWLQERPFGTGQPGQAPRAVWAGVVEEVVGRSHWKGSNRPREQTQSTIW